MTETGLLLSLAEIAGVFVGFGALIAVRSGGASDVHEVAYVRAVVWMGLMAIVAALAPVTIGGYGLSAHEIWVLSSILVLIGYWGMVGVSYVTPELRADRATASRTFLLLEGSLSMLIGVAMLAALLTILLGLQPALEAALYVTVVVLILLGTVMTLLTLVFTQRRPQVD